MSFNDEAGEELRKCPTCRSMISVMATRCRHCGEKVSRPKTEEERFTIQDLGGVSEANYKVSEHVMGAIEAFRAEELNASGGPEVFHTPTRGGRQSSQSRGLELDAAHRALAEAVAERPEERARRQALTRKVQRQDDTLRNVALALAIAAGLVALVAGGIKLQHYLASREVVETPVYVNHALEWLNDGEHTKLEALEEANRALRYDASPQNLSAADTVRAALEEEVRELLNAVPWDRDKHSRASAMANRAAEVDASRRIQDLRHGVQREVNAFMLVLTEINVAEGTAKFAINDLYYTGEKTQVVKVDDLLRDRFTIQAIFPNQVEFYDNNVVGPNQSTRRFAIRVRDPLRAIP